MSWILINNQKHVDQPDGSTGSANIKTYAYQIRLIGCLVMVETDRGNSTVFVPGTEINGDKLTPMRGYGLLPEDYDGAMEDMSVR
jgi:hypothetical protein